MTGDQLKESIRQASIHAAESAITTPGAYLAYGEWVTAKKALQAAEARVSAAEANWLELISPALDDPNFRAIAESRGLIPVGWI